MLTLEDIKHSIVFKIKETMGSGHKLLKVKDATTINTQVRFYSLHLLMLYLGDI